MTTETLTATPATKSAIRARGFWGEAWKHFRRRRLSMLALAYVIGIGLIGILAPAIVGVKPIVCMYKGEIYFPALGYFNPSWENPIFKKDRFRNVYPANLEKKDPESWAIWPIIYQDPVRRVRDKEWPGQPANLVAEKGVPNRYNLLGTDRQGVDVFAQIVHGATTALLVGFLSMGIAAAIGVTLGALAGYFGGWIDMIVSRVIEVVMCVPTLILILALLAILERPTIWHMMVVLGCTGWTGIARLTRAEFMKLKESDFVVAARGLGARWTRIVFRHILPNSLAPILVPITFGIASAILIESALSFLGFGADPSTPSWGKVLDGGRRNYDMWWLILFPGLAIFLTVLAYNLIGEGLQEATDPRLRGGSKV